MKNLYAILDNVANAIVGGIMHLHADAPAIRMFGDAITGDKQLAAHPDDYDLICLGAMSEPTDHAHIKIVENYRVVLTGKALRAATTPAQPIKLEA